MARLICVDNGDELRLICPECHTTWSTTQVPAECPTCTALITIRVVKSAPKMAPRDGEHVGPCHYSKTGWAVWNERRACTCKPAKRPKDEGAAYDAFDTWANPKTT